MLLKFLGKYRDTGLLLMRLALGVMMMLHGLPKLMHPKVWSGVGSAMGNLGVHFAPAFWGFMAAVTEGIGGMLLAIGIFYRPVALMLAFTMFVAAMSHHHKSDKFMESTSRPVELCIVFFGLAFIGPGRFSVDKD